MQIKYLQIRDFRNLISIDTDFAPGTNVIYGTNAQGKTNILEAIYLLVTGRSFRTTNESELAPWAASDYNGTLIKATISKAAGEEQIALFISSKEKRVTIDGKPADKLVNLVGRLNAVLFTPTDLLLVRGAPALRRRFMDIAIGQVHPRYLNALQTYQHVLKNRNILLKRLAGREQSSLEQLDVYDEQLAASGAHIMQMRKAALDELAENGSRHYRLIAGQNEAFTLEYQPNVSKAVSLSSKEDMMAAFTQSRQEDLRRMTTSRGPHRDDFEFRIQDYPARHFASQGQQRTAVLAIKLSEMDYLRTHSGETPLLMLDDLMSELDKHRKMALLTHLDPSVQTFITTTDPQSITRYSEISNLIHIRLGSIEKSSNS